MSMRVRLIKRYPNRKLYDTSNSRYITLEGIAELIKQGDEVKVVDHKSKEDLTSMVLAQIIFEEEKNKRNIFPLPTLKKMIQQSGERVQNMISHSVKSIHDAREEAGQMVDSLIKKGKSSSKVLLAESKRELDEIQSKVDHAVKRAIDGVTSLSPANHQSIIRLEDKVTRLEQLVDRLLAQIDQSSTPNNK